VRTLPASFSGEGRGEAATAWFADAVQERRPVLPVLFIMG